MLSVALAAAAAAGLSERLGVLFGVVQARF